VSQSAVRAAGLLGPTLALALAVTLVGATEARGQVVADSTLVSDSLVADSAAVQVAVPDSLTQEVDSARLAIMDRLERLARPVGADSVLYVQDSVRLAEAAAGQRPGRGSDSIASALMMLPGYSLTEYEGAEADFGAADRVLVLQAPPEGRARVTQEGLVIEADSSITFDESTGSMRTVGEATFTPPDGDPVTAANMIYDVSQGRGTAVGARTTYGDGGANWIVSGDMPYAAPDSTFMAHARFTSCEIEDPHYHFETDEIKLVGGNLMVARGVRLYFADVPVAWFPFLAQSITRGRRSGLLTPQFSVNDIVRTSGGYRRRLSNLGFYWAASEYADALVAMDWFSETFVALTSSVRYSFSRQFLQGDLSFKRFWNEDGSTELALDTRHSWEIDERTQLRVSGRFISNNDFVRENSFNPQEVTQSIDSEAGLNRRFDWGSVSFSANRKQYLSDDRTEWLLPSVNVSLSPITLFKAPSSEATAFNNMTWSGSAGMRRNAMDRVQPDTFNISIADNSTLAGNVRSNLSIGRLTFSQSANIDRRTLFDVPEVFAELGDSADRGDLVIGVPARSISEETLGWNANLGYQQQLIGSTTITPRLSLAGSFFRSDTEPLAQTFVAAPSRASFGAQLKTDMYGFYPGWGSFEAMRHKFSPSIDYQYSPETTPSDLQQDVFNSRTLQPLNTISLSLTQTWEAKRRPNEEGEAGFDPNLAPGALPPDSLTALDTLGVGPMEVGRNDPFAEAQEDGAGPRRVQQNPSVTLLAWRTSVIKYDFVQADSAGSSLLGFETTRLSNQFSSDYLRGLSISMDHELWVDEIGEGLVSTRSFDPHLANLNLGFSLGSSSSIFKWLSFFGDDEEAPATEPESTEPLEFQGPTDNSSIVPGVDRRPTGPAGARGSTGGWNASLTYSLQRPRDPRLLAAQMLSGSLRLQPTENWSVSWRTAYDLELNQFNDHSIRLSRDLHRWEANFDFLQTATGNWTFRFEVRLTDNDDLKFDYRQRNLDLGLPTSQR
jgi:hypothetical protein